MTTDVPRLNDFQPHQIVYLAYDHSRLYAEIIDILAERQLAWARPLVLVTPEEVLPLTASSALGLGDLQDWSDSPTAPDLLWPLHQFCPALDTDFVDLLARLPAQPTQPTKLPRNLAVSQFTRRLWAATGVQAQAGG